MRGVSYLILSSTLFQTEPGNITMNESPITISVVCVGNPRCIFDGNDIPLQITVKNSSKKNVGFSVEYLTQKGPNVQLTDRISSESLWLRVSKPPAEIADKFDIIAPNDSFELETTVTASEIRSFRHEMVDLDINVVIGAKLKPELGDARSYSASTAFRIVGKDTDYIQRIPPAKLP